MTTNGTHAPYSTKTISPLFLKKLDVEAMTDTVSSTGHTSDTSANNSDTRAAQFAIRRRGSWGQKLIGYPLKQLV